MPALFISRLYCTMCRTPRDIPRRKNQKRERYHIKDMFCATCQRKRQFIENAK